MLRNLTIGKKIILGFGLVLLLLVVTGVVGWRSLDSSIQGFNTFNEASRDTNIMGRVQANLLSSRLAVRWFLHTQSEASTKSYAQYFDRVKARMEEAKNHLTTPEQARVIATVGSNLAHYDAAFQRVRDLAATRKKLDSEVLVITGREMERRLTEIIRSAKSDGDVNSAFLSSIALRSLLLGRVYVVKFMEHNDPAHVERVGKELGETRQLLSQMDKEIQDPARRKLRDEAAQNLDAYAKGFDKYVELSFAINKITEESLERLGPEIAQQTEDLKLAIMKEQEQLGSSMVASNQRAVTTVMVVVLVALVLGLGLAFLITRGLVRSLSSAIANLSDGSDQVASASTQVSSASQTLAQGAGEQAASLEETSASLEEITSMVKQNADNASQANNLAQETRQVMDQANQAMTELTRSMDEISQAGEQTGRIIKTIDEIAFQTNLLALNAAVEAARAGEAGAGFAVVAEEVRNLAQRAAEAAKSTATLIEGTIKKTKEGSDLVTRTGEAFQAVQGRTQKMGELVGEIAAASKEQSQGIGQINIAMSQVDKVTQEMAANAEESAAASEELSAQADTMRTVVTDLAGLVGGSSQGGHGRRARARRAIAHQAPSSRQAKAAAPEALPAPSRWQGKADPEKAIPLEDDFQNF